MTAAAVISPISRSRSLAPLAPIAGIVFAAFFVIGMAMPVLPLHVHDRLGMSAFVVGLVAGSQLLASLLSRLWAGRITDSHGPKRAVLLGLVFAVVGGACYLGSLSFLLSPNISVSVLLVGRAFVGGAESLTITGGMLWALGRVPRDRAAQVIAWVGMAMFAAMAIAAPIGSYIFSRSGLTGIAVASAAVPMVALAVATAVKPLPPVDEPNATMSTVLGAVLLPGLGFALSGITFGAVTAFLTLYFSVQGWGHGAMAFTAFALALVLTRIVAGHLPDRLGGARVALGSLGVQAAGLALVGLAHAEWIAVLGASVAGLGFSLVFPSLGLEGVRRVAPANRGTAMGVYNAFLDLTLGLGSPLLGGLAAKAGIGSVFLASAGAALLALPIAARLQRQS